MRMAEILLAYFLMGAMLWGGGVIDWDQSGMAQVVVSPTDTGATANESTGAEIRQMGGPIQQAAAAVGAGGLLAVWNFLALLLGMMFWPITALNSINAPPEVVVVVGGTFSMVFIGALLRAVRSDA